MPAYDPKRPRPAAGRAEEPAPVEALLEPASSSPVVEPAADAPEAATPEVPTVDVAASSDESSEPVDETSTPSEVTEVEAPEARETEIEEPAVGHATAAGALRDADDLEVDLRDVSSNGSHAGAHEVPVAPAPNEVTTNRAVLVAGISVAALVSLIVAVLLRRRRRSD